MKKRKFICLNPHPCFPGQYGWEHLPEGYTGKYYTWISSVITRYETHGHDRLPCRASVDQALQDARQFKASENLPTLAVKLPENGGWVIL